ncbi:MAG: hypothetical protein CL875_04865 [Dehalococcoidales bacterium]|nr:hypothetical protein [Dehalococcoidales bacterium]
MQVEVIMPRLGQEMEKGTIVEWYKHEDDRIEEGAPLFQVEMGNTRLDKTKISISEMECE